MSCSPEDAPVPAELRTNASVLWALRAADDERRTAIMGEAGLWVVDAFPVRESEAILFAHGRRHRPTMPTIPATHSVVRTAPDASIVRSTRPRASPLLGD
jgi:hypothetical protein